MFQDSNLGQSKVVRRRIERQHSMRKNKLITKYNGRQTRIEVTSQVNYDES